MILLNFKFVWEGFFVNIKGFFWLVDIIIFLLFGIIFISGIVSIFFIFCIDIILLVFIICGLMWLIIRLIFLMLCVFKSLIILFVLWIAEIFGVVIIKVFWAGAIVFWKFCLIFAGELIKIYLYFGINIFINFCICWGVIVFFKWFWVVGRRDKWGCCLFFIIVCFKWYFFDKIFIVV